MVGIHHCKIFLGEDEVKHSLRCHALYVAKILWEMDMLKTLEEVTHRLIKYCEAERIILYGSYATGRAREDSDLDLLIVKATEKRSIDRQIEVEQLLSDRAIPMDITVYTPQEIRWLFSIGDPFIEEVLEKGRLIFVRKATEGWIKDAEDELESASILYEHGKTRGACYHSQQCVEKGLKALILEKGDRPERIHDLVDLLHKATGWGWDTGLSMDDAVFLNSLYKGRYPTEMGLLPYGEPSVEDAERAVSAARGFLETVKGLLRA